MRLHGDEDKAAERRESCRDELREQQVVEWVEEEHVGLDVSSKSPASVTFYAVLKKTNSRV